MRNIRFITLDLDDTLWPIAPAIARAEQALLDWFAEHCPAVARRHNPHTLRQLRFEAQNRHPELAGDLSALRKASIRLALATARAEESLVDSAFEAFWTARNTVELYPDVDGALLALRRHYRLAVVTNGNADIERIGLAHHFEFSLCAREAGCEKPDERIFLQACARAGVEPGEALHAGDDLRCDVEGALNAGLHAAWIDREESRLHDNSHSHAGRRHRDLNSLVRVLESHRAA